jgi:cation-transporting P-type ATPase F
VWTIPTNIGEGLVIVAAIALGVELPILPVQILWINMTTAVILGLPLAFEPRQPDVMDRPPRDSSAPMIDRDLLMRSVFVGTLLLVFSFGIYLMELERGLGITDARTSATNAFVVMEAFYLFNCRTLVAPMRTVGFFTNPWVWGGVGLMAVLQAIFTYVPFFNTFFHSTAIDLVSWGACFAAGIAVLALVALEKRIRASIRASARR